MSEMTARSSPADNEPFRMLNKLRRELADARRLLREAIAAGEAPEIDRRSREYTKRLDDFCQAVQAAALAQGSHFGRTSCETRTLTERFTGASAGAATRRASRLAGGD